MSVRVVPWKPEVAPGKWRVDIRFKKPSGEKIRNQTVYEAPTRGMAKRWGEARETQLRSGSLTITIDKAQKTAVMTVAKFAPEWIEKYLEANLHKKSGTDAAESIVRVHLLPFIGSKTLDEVTDDVFANLKAKWVKGGYTTPDGKRTIGPTTSRKTLNNRASVLSSMLHTAVRWKKSTGLAEMPCTIEMDRVDSQKTPDFHDHETYERLVDGARLVDPRVYALVLLAGDGGLRRGEIIGLDLVDIDFRAGRFTPRRSVFIKKGKRHEDVVKGELAKPVPCTPRLLDALKAVRHLRGERLLYTDGGEELTPKIVRMWVMKAERAAKLPETGRVHKFRHTFCSHAAMAGVPAMTIKELARHGSLAITMRYMHLSPSAKDEGIEMLSRSRAAGGVAVASGRGNA